MQLTTEEVLHLLQELDVELKEEADEVRGFLTIAGRRVLAVHCPLVRPTLPDGMAQRFRKALKLSEAEFEDLRNGALGRDDYLDLLREKGELR
jgi:hypothetical protein